MSIHRLKFSCSFLVNRSLQFYFRFLFQTLLLKKESKSWKLYIERLSHPVGIPYAMLNAPRWNTHAFIASVGPLTVNNTIEIDFSNLERLCSSWTFILYKLPSNTTYKVISSLHTENMLSNISVEAGSYSLVLRCYELQYPAILPSIKIDKGRIHILERIIEKSIPVYPAKILGKKSGVYSFIHYYLHYMFTHRDETFRTKLEEEYLPVGNPETTFRYGYFHFDNYLQICLAIKKTDFLLFITCYNESSFPIFSERIPVDHNAVYTTPSFKENGTYLIRIIPLNKELTTETLRSAIEINVLT